MQICDAQDDLLNRISFLGLDGRVKPCLAGVDAF
jgi:hypothetical protein